jgi:hypothetical protein
MGFNRKRKMKTCFRFFGPLTFICGLIMISLSLVHPAAAAPRVPSGGLWVSFDTQPSYPPGVAPLAQNLVNYLNKDGGADSTVYVPELHRLFARYQR